jgi:hypothetical protein
MTPLRRFRILDYAGFKAGEGAQFSNGLCAFLVYKPKGEMHVGMSLEELKERLKPDLSIEFID